jgi:hypothetical protein
LSGVDSLDGVDEERSREVGDVVRKGVALLAAMAVVIAGGTWLLVHALGLNSADDAGTVLGTPAPVTPLPTTALPVPGDTATTGDTAGPDAIGSAAAPGTTRPGAAGPPAARGLHLNITPLRAAPGERINITGTYPRHDNVSVQVQRLEGGTWADFPTQAQVDMGTFETYVMTSHTGPNKFRVYDPQEDRASNVVTVRIG